MKKKNLLLGAAAALCLSLPAQALPDGWYVSLEGGANWVQDWNFNTKTAQGTTPGSMSFDMGWAVLATVGYDFGHWAAEFETGYRHNNFDKITTGGAPASYYDITLDETSFMANLKYNYAVTDKLTLSLGGGVGADHAKLHVETSGSTEDQDWNFAYQGIASAGYAVGTRSEVFISYRYFRTTSAQFDFQPVLGEVWDGENFEKHTATIGFRYYLNGGAPAEPMSAPPPPAEAGKPTEYIIFFGHNKSALTPAALDVVKEAATAAKADGVANIKLVGHTDRSGSDSYNQSLSLRRAKATKAALVSQGVAEGTIAMEAKGESEPLVPTADGVREPQNRRVNINF